VVPNLLVEGIAKALIQSDGLKVYVCNVATQSGETDGYDFQAHLDALVRHLPGQQNPVDVIVVATARPGEAAAHEPDVTLVTAEPGAVGQPRIAVEDVVRDDHALRHDPDKLAAVLLRIYDEERRARSSNGTVRVRAAK
jgi:uncharacterized cofD-like protein